MKKKYENLRRFFLPLACFAVILVCGLFLHPMNAQAADGDTEDEELSLTVELSYDDVLLPDVDVYIYRVGSWTGTGLVLEGDFADLPITLTTVDGEIQDVDWDALAVTLSGYAYLDSMEPYDQDITDENGFAYFPLDGKTLEAGVYLVLTYAFQLNGVAYTIQPFLVFLPGLEGNQVIYHVVAIPKIASRFGTQRITVLKIWDDANSTSRPDSIEVTLVSGLGEIWDTVTLSEENNWRYTFTGLPEDTSWYVVESVPDGYTVLQRADGNTIAITNSLKEEEESTTQSEQDTTPSEESTTASEEETSTDEEEGTTAAEEDTSASGDDATTVIDHGAGESSTTTKKSSSTSTEDDTTTTAEIQKLPQTGTIWWVVPILVGCGMASMIIGMAKKHEQENEE